MSLLKKGGTCGSATVVRIKHSMINYDFNFPFLNATDGTMTTDVCNLITKSIQEHSRDLYLSYRFLIKNEQYMKYL